MVEFVRRERFCERGVRGAGVVVLGGMRMKRYEIVREGEVVDQGSYARGEEMAAGLMPREAVGRDRPGVGFVIRHTGAGVEYLVVCWWDNQNELITRVLVRAGGGEWRDAAGAFSYCVWDLEVMWKERGAYVRRVMMPERADVDGYAGEFVV